MSRIGSVAALILMGCLATACTTTSVGEPRPTESTSNMGSASPSSKPTRPRDLRLDGRDPCTLIPPADRAKFYIERPGEPGQNEVYKSPECEYSTDVGGFRVTLVMTEGIEKWTDGSKNAKASEASPVAGFPAISITTSFLDSRCDVAVDVADGQYLLAMALVISTRESQLPERCEYAHQLAESAMSTLVGA